LVPFFFVTSGARMYSFGFTGREMRTRLLLALLLAASLCIFSAGAARAAGPVDLGDPGGEGLYLAGLSEDGYVAGHIAFPADGVRRAFSGSAAAGMINLAPFGGSGPKAGASASAISGTGVVVGDSSLQRGATPGDVVNHAFSWTPTGGMIDLGSLGGDLAGAAGVSENGKIVVGVSTIPGEAVVPAFVWTQAGGMIQLRGLPGATCPKWCSVARVVNDAGLIAGTTYGTDNQVHGVVWLPSGDIFDLGVFGTQSSPSAINASGQVVGSRIVGGVTRAFSWTLAGGIVDIAPPAPGSQSFASDVNDAGTVVGTVNDHPFVWTHAGGLVVLGSLGGGSGTGRASGINAGGVVVGTSTALDLRRHPFIWTPSTGMIDIGLPSKGWVEQSWFISDSGWIAGTATLTTSASESNRPHVFLWSAADYLPEPATEPEPDPVPDPVALTPATSGAGDAVVPVTPVLPPAAAPSPLVPVIAPPTAIAAVIRGNAASAVKARSRAYAAEVGRHLRSLKACSTLACSLRQVRALGAAQRAYAAFVRKDAARPAQCGAAARILGVRLGTSETARAALQRAILRAQRGAKGHLAAPLHTAVRKASGTITASRTYAAACG
jgi:probable HAF family extracellular repeat protein